MHHLVAGYLQYKPEPAEQDEPDGPDEAPELTSATSPPAAAHMPWMPGLGTVPASSELLGAATAEDALAAAERLFFGPLMEI